MDFAKIENANSDGNREHLFTINQTKSRPSIHHNSPAFENFLDVVVTCFEWIYLLLLLCGLVISVLGLFNVFTTANMAASCEALETDTNIASYSNGLCFVTDKNGTELVDMRFRAYK